MQKTLTIPELQEHIKTTVLPMIKETVGENVKDVVSGAVEEALKPIRGDMTKAEADRQDILSKINEAKNEPSQLTNGTRERKKGEAFGRMVWALTKHKNNRDRAVDTLKQVGDKDLAELLTKAMTAGDPETGGILIPDPVAQEVIDILRDRVVVRGLGAVELPMPAGNLRLPKKTQGTSAYYVGESTAGTTSKVKTGDVKLSFKKLVTLVPVSNDLFRYSSPGADQLIRNDIIDNTAVREDQAFLRDNGTDSTPKGILQHAIDGNRTIAANATVSLANATTDLGKLILSLIEANCPMIRPGWIMAPRTWNYLMTVRTTNGPYAFREEMARGMLWGWPFKFTTQVPTTLDSSGLGNDNESDLYLADFSDVVIGDSQRLMIDASGEAAYEEGGSVKSTFHRDETVVRGITEHDMVIRRDACISVLRNMTWGA